MKKVYLIIMLSTLLMFVYSTPCLAGWLIFHKPEFKGKVIDAETKAPIEGAVVVVFYYKITLIEWPSGPSSYVIHYKEVLTDKKGEFYLPSYTTLISPNSKEYYTEFIIYKPGYGNFPRNRISPPKRISRQTEEEFFLAETFGKQGEIKVRFGKVRKRNYTKQKVTFGLVELPPLKILRERLVADPGTPIDFGSKELPLLFKAINEQRKSFGLKPVGRP